MKGIIYKITNKVTNLSYIGQTRYTAEFRWNQHKHTNDNSYFHNAIRKYGPENFTVEVVEECDVKDLDSKEIYYISKYNTFNAGYNLTIGGDGKRKITSDNQYDEIKGLYLSGFSCNKIATLFNVSKKTILNILHTMGVKLRKNNLSINKQEVLELAEDYKNGYSLRELSKRYGCDPQSLKAFLIRKGIDISDRYSILKDEKAQTNLINDYLDGTLKLSEIQSKYHCSYNTLKKILSINGVSDKKHHFKLNSEQCLKVIKLFNDGVKVSQLAKQFEVNKTTIYSLLKRHNINYLTV